MSSKSVIAAGVGLVVGAGVGIVCGIIGTASLPNNELEKLRKDMGIVPNVPKENTADTSITKEEKVEG